MKTVDGLLVRPGTMDEYIVKECRKQYAALEVGSGDIVLDIGANIGAFAVPASRKADLVVAYEPEQENYALLERNAAGSAIQTHRAAVMPEAGSTDLFVTPGPNKGHHSTVIARGRTVQPVPAVAWRTVLGDMRWDVLKFDAEGAEYDLDWSDLPRSLERVAIELDFGRKAWRGAAVAIADTLAAQGFRAVKAPRLEPNKLWYTLGIWHR